MPPEAIRPSRIFAAKQDVTAGLRLPTAYAIVKQLGGYIDIESDNVDGTRFNVYFPIKPNNERPPSLALPKPYRARNGTRKAMRHRATQPRLILIAEDQQDVQQNDRLIPFKSRLRNRTSSNGSLGHSQFASCRKHPQKMLLQEIFAKSIAMAFSSVYPTRLLTDSSWESACGS